MTNKNWYALIMAGGAGTRLYPRSSEAKPKQFQKIIGGKTLLRQTFERAKKVVPENNIYVSTNHKYRLLVKNELPQIGNDKIITEPVKRNTAPAMALATTVIANRDPSAVIATLPSDHMVLYEQVFAEVLAAEFRAVQKSPNYMAAVGIQPTKPHTGYGYIERGSLHADDGEFSIYKVKRFVEKPDVKTAQQYLKKGTFYWNAAYFLWNARHFLVELEKHLPVVSKGLKTINFAIGKPNFNKVLDEEFQKFPEAAVDTAIMEKTKNLLIIPANLGWSDIGSWDALIELIEQKKRDQDGNFAEGLHIGIETKNTVILSHDPKKLIATIGLENAIVVTSQDAILISAQGLSEQVKKVVEKIKEKKLKHLL